MKILRLDSRSDFVEIKRRNTQRGFGVFCLYVCFVFAFFLARTTRILGYK